MSAPDDAQGSAQMTMLFGTSRAFDRPSVAALLICGGGRRLGNTYLSNEAKFIFIIR